MEGAIVMGRSSKLTLVAIVCCYLCTVVGGQETLVSPCPNVFQYRNYRNELIGYITVAYPEQRVNKLDVVFQYISRTGGNSTLSLTEDLNTVLRRLENGQLVYYRLFFPPWDEIEPTIKEIRVNGRLICRGPEIEYEGTASIRTKTVSHTLFMTTRVVDTSPNEVDAVEQPPQSATSRPTRRPTRRPTTTTTPSWNTPEPPGSTAIPATSSSNGQCGLSNIRNFAPLIYDGTDFEKGKFPWLAAMYVRSKNGVLNYQCVGNLITRRHLITAAHCCEKPNTHQSVPNMDMLFALGLHDLSKLGTEEDSTMIQARFIRPHVDYVFGSGDADIAVVVLERDVPQNNYIRPICLWPAEFGDGFGSGAGTIAGWGSTPTEGLANIPTEVSIPIVPGEQCLRSNPAFGTLTSTRTFCAGDRANRGPCSGDSGSAFMMQRNSMWYIRGIVSLSLRNATTQLCDLNNYVVFTDVVRFRDWIDQQVRDTS